MTLDVAAQLVLVLWGVAIAVLMAASGLAAVPPSPREH